MTVDLATVLLRTIPPAFAAGVSSGELGVFGSVIRSVADGRIVAHLQETGGLTSLVGKFLIPAALPMEAAKMASGAIGDGLILEQGRRIKAAVDLLSRAQMANLLMSGATLGVSVAGFAVLSAKITRLERQISSLEQRLVDLRRSVDALRKDRINEDLSWLRTMLQQMDESWTLRAPSAQLERVAHDSHILANRFFDRARTVLETDGPRLQEAAPFLEAVGLAQSVRVEARMAADEYEAARGATAEALDQYDALLEYLDATDDALRIVVGANEATDRNEWAFRLETAIETTRPITAGVRLRGEAMAATHELLGTLSRSGVNGRQFLQAARDEHEAPFLIIPITE